MASRTGGAPWGWSSRSTNSATRLSVSTAAALVGTRGLQAQGSNTNYVQRNFGKTPNLPLRLTTRGSTSTPTIMRPLDRTSSLAGDCGHNQLFHVRYRRNGAQPQVQIQVGAHCQCRVGEHQQQRQQRHRGGVAVRHHAAALLRTGRCRRPWRDGRRKRGCGSPGFGDQWRKQYPRVLRRLRVQALGVDIIRTLAEVSRDGGCRGVENLPGHPPESQEVASPLGRRLHGRQSGRMRLHEGSVDMRHDIGWYVSLPAVLAVVSRDAPRRWGRRASTPRRPSRAACCYGVAAPTKPGGNAWPVQPRHTGLARRPRRGERPSRHGRVGATGRQRRAASLPPRGRSCRPPLPTSPATASRSRRSAWRRPEDWSTCASRCSTHPRPRSPSATRLPGRRCSPVRDRRGATAPRDRGVRLARGHLLHPHPDTRGAVKPASTSGGRGRCGWGW